MTKYGPYTRIHLLVILRQLYCYNCSSKSDKNTVEILAVYHRICLGVHVPVIAALQYYTIVYGPHTCVRKLNLLTNTAVITNHVSFFLRPKLCSHNVTTISLRLSFPVPTIVPGLSGLGPQWLELILTYILLTS